MAYSCFKLLAVGIESWYGSLCGEYSLEEPEELVRDPRSFAFSDCFLRRDRFAPDALEAVRRIAGPESYIEEFGEAGLYVSMSPELNPEHRSLEVVESEDRSVRIARLLVQYLSPAPPRRPGPA